MTIEEKARAYDEALETARKLNSGEGVAVPPGWTVCEVIFPELQESEDDKIRKAILDHLTIMWGNSQDDVCGVHVEDAIAWLEKQASKPKWSEEDERICNNIIADIGGLKSHSTNTLNEYFSESINWLKSLKKRIKE